MSPKQTGRNGIYEAAGGILWRKTPAGRQLAVVHRPHYDDWTLPKGWREKGESMVEAAVREVQEETNCKVRLGTFAGCSCYPVEDVPKIVLFWHMELVKERKFKPNEETRPASVASYRRGNDQTRLCR